MECPPLPPSLSSASPQQEPAGEEAAEPSGNNRRSAGRQMGRERLLRYVHDVIRKQRTPLHEIVRDHALSFLPAQSLLRFRAVSTSWNRHISSPFFAHTQSLSHRSPSGLFPTSQPYPPSSYLPFDSDSGAVPDSSFDFLPESAVQVRASARGLVCCSSVGNPYRRARYYVCNPATAQWTAVPSSRFFDHHAVALLFQPSLLNFSADFYLVCIVENNRRTGFEVFSSSSGSWRISNEVVTGGGLLCSDLAVATGGAAHWGTASGAVLSFYPAADRCRLTQLPEDVAAQGSSWRLAEVNGRLCCCCVRRPSSEGTVAADVYVLLREGGMWKKMRRLEVVGVEVWPLISEAGDREVLFCVDGGVVGFSLVSARGRLLRGTSTGVGTGECLPYVSSLATVKM